MAKEIKADYCIAGAGIAGILLASRLSASGKKIVMLDQGTRYSDEDLTGMISRQKRTLNDFADYNDEEQKGTVTPHSSAGESDTVAQWTHQRLFGIGGSALHFEGNMMRPREDDLRVKTLYGYGRDWPIDYQELEPWLLEAEREVGVAGADDNPYASPRSGPFPMPAHPFSYFDREIMGPALKRLGITGHSSARGIASRAYRGRSSCMACRACKFCPSGARYSPDRVHVPALDKMPNVSILERVSLRMLETNTKGDRIIAAHTINVEEGSPLIVRAKRFIVTMGGVETTRILMLSAGAGLHKEGLGNSGGQLGRMFGDHFNIFATFDAGKNIGSRLGFETMNSDHFRVNVDRREQPTFMLFTAPAIDWVPAGIYATEWASKGDILDLNELRDSISRIAFMYAMTELQGNGSIELNDKYRDAFGAPVAKITMKLSDWDRRSLDAFETLLPQIAESMKAKHVSEVYPDLGMGYHPSGATAMARTPDSGVCDPNLKVFGLNNLYLVSNSVFPHMASNPPTLIISALALRLAAHLEGRAK
jgi:choline dehydrogenase-like flavoprotein